MQRLHSGHQVGAVSEHLEDQRHRRRAGADCHPEPARDRGSRILPDPLSIIRCRQSTVTIFHSFLSIHARRTVHCPVAESAIFATMGDGIASSTTESLAPAKTREEHLSAVLDTRPASDRGNESIRADVTSLLARSIISSSAADRPEPWGGTVPFVSSCCARKRSTAPRATTPIATTVPSDQSIRLV